MKNKRYKKIKKTILAGASTGIVAGMILMGSASQAFADTTDYSVSSYSQNTATEGMHMMHRWNSTTKISSLAGHLGLDQEEIKSELKSGKNLKQILQDHGIVPGQLQKAFGSKKRNSDGRWAK